MRIRKRHWIAAAAVLAVTVIFLCIFLSQVERTAAAQDSQSLSVSEDRKLVVYTSHKEEVYEPLFQEFQARTGIWVEVTTGGTIELLEMIAAANGDAACDVMFGGGVESYEAYKEYFDSYRCNESEYLSGSFYSGDGKWTAFSQLPIVFVYNNKLVEAADAPRTWAELLQEQWKGEIAFADPKTSGTSCTALLTMCQVLELTPKQVVEAFSGNLCGDILPDSGLVIDEVTQGTKLVGITLEESALKAKKLGADISILYPEDGISAVPDGAALVKAAPHGENARLFLDFIISKDVQELLGDRLCRRSVRTDMEQKEGFLQITVMDFNLDWASANQRPLLDWWVKAQAGRPKVK